MTKRYSTIIFVPHARAKFRKMRVSHRLMIAAFTVLVSSLVLSVFFSVQYFTSLSHTHELAQLKRENRELTKANEAFSRSVDSLRHQLQSVEEKTRKLAIIAGVTTLDLGGQGGVGGARTTDELATSVYRDEIDKMSYASRHLAEDLSLLEQRLNERSRFWSATPSIAPARGILTDGFGTRVDPFTGQRDQHAAVDISTDHGHPVVAPADGIVVKADWANGYGNVIYVSHGYGYSTRYGHLSKFAVKPGQRVRRGEVIGYVGSTGRSTGPHLHYEVRMNNNPVNPLEYILNAF